MRIKDKMLIEAGHITKAKVKWWGGGFAYPYLWKDNKSDKEYKEAWADPRIPNTDKKNEQQKQDQNQETIINRPRTKMG